MFPGNNTDKGEDGRGYWRAIYTAIWDDRDFQELSPAEKLVFLTLRTSPLSNRSCLYVYYSEAIKRQTGLSDVEIKDAIETLKDKGWISEDDGIVWVKHALRFDPAVSLDNENHVKMIIKEVRGLPKIQIVDDFCEFYRLQNKDVEHREDKIKSKEEKDALDRIVNAWNVICGKVLPKVTMLTDLRVKHLRARLIEHPEFEFWEKLFRQIINTPFLLGDSSRGWKCNFDWVLNPSNMVKILEENWQTTKQLAAAQGTKTLPKGPDNNSRNLWGKCKQCGKESLLESLNAKGLCFNCNPDVAMNQQRLKELMSNIGKKVPDVPPTT